LPLVKFIDLLIAARADSCSSIIIDGMVCDTDINPIDIVSRKSAMTVVLFSTIRRLQLIRPQMGMPK
jgi:hypothetical protein